MPVTIKPAGHGAEKIPLRYTLPRDSLELLKTSCKRESQECKEILQSSYGDKLQAPIDHSSNGFVHGAIRAYNGHHHLRIRPEDVWFAVLSQFSLFVNAHAEELRGLFVAHEGKKELVLTYPGNRYSVDFGRFAKEMGEQIEEKVVDPDLRRWIMPAFSTTTENDIVVASILLMGTTQKYFDYKCYTLCGFFLLPSLEPCLGAQHALEEEVLTPESARPTVTLLGNKEDWELILRRLEKLKEYGEEPTQFCNLLRPVVSRFIKSFDNPTADEITGFWQRIAHYSSGGSGPSYYCGWITAFCFWNKDGKSVYRPHQSPDRITDDDETWYESHALKLDGMVYHLIESHNVPPGYSSVPVKVDDNGVEIQATMIAGSVAMRYSSSQDYEHDFDTIQPESGWWMFEKKEAKKGSVENLEALSGTSEDLKQSPKTLQEPQEVERSRKWYTKGCCHQ
ncbi:MAG: hypothetical protein Q9184_001817 [Pyrenodesmia sp. 2 TL-2023]